MAVYTRRLTAGRVDTTATALVIYTAPVDQITILRDIVVGNLSGAAADVQFLVRVGASTVWLWGISAMTARSTSHLDLRQQIAAGEQIQLSSTSPNTTWLLTGYVFPA